LKTTEDDLELLISGDANQDDQLLTQEKNGSDDKQFCKMHKRAKVINVDFTLNRKTEGTEVKLVLPLKK
jgi:hypothetical protein